MNLPLGTEIIPSKIVCVGLNYVDHAREMKMTIPDEPVIFLKPPTTVIGPGEAIVRPRGATELSYEAELAVVIGQRAKDVSPAEANEYIAGYTCANDVTVRELQRKDGQWTRSKSFDTFCPLGPRIVPADEISPADLSIKLFVNGELRQDSTTKNLIVPVPELVSFISRVMTLLPGDVILTGTPAGVGLIQPGDVVEVEIDGIGRLSNPVVGL